MIEESSFFDNKKEKIRSYFIERRRHYRLIKEIKVRYKFISQLYNLDNTSSYDAVTKNMSTSGLLLKAEIPKVDFVNDMMLKKTLVFLEIFLSKNKPPIKATAQLRWVESIDASKNLYNIGLKFIDITQEDKNTITEFILNSI